MCCLFGLIDYKRKLSAFEKSKIISVLSRECEVRGTDSTGIAYNHNGSLRIFKRPLPAHKMRFRIPEDASVIMGHTRYATQGDEKFNFNNHPFKGTTSDSVFALAHNGVLYNDLTLRRTLKLPHTHIQTDSYIAVQLIEDKDSLDFSTLKYMAEKVDGSFAFTLLDSKNNMYFIKGDNPLCIYHYPKDGIIIYASTEDILLKALKKLRITGCNEQIPITCGDILKADCTGNLSSDVFNTESMYYDWHMPYYFGTPKPKSTSSSYEDDLKSLAGYFGYAPEDIQELLEDGFTADELADYLYSERVF